jgi:hypothetical protein
MIIPKGSYISDHQKTREAEMASSLVDGLSRVGDFKGSITTLTHAMAQRGVWFSCPQFSTFRRLCEGVESELTAKGVRVEFLDEQGADIRVSKTA